MLYKDYNLCIQGAKKLAVNMTDNTPICVEFSC